MTHRKQLEELFYKHGFKDIKWIDPKTIIVSQWVRIKCMFGCKEYGKNASCPPNTLSKDECKSFFNEYDEGVVFREDFLLTAVTRLSELLPDCPELSDTSRVIDLGTCTGGKSLIVSMNADDGRAMAYLAHP